MRRYRRYLVLLVIIAATVFTLVSTAAQSGSSWPFANVSPDQLAGQGVTLTPVAASAAPGTSATSAAAAASSFEGNDPTLTSPQYMHCVDTTRVPEINQDCWVVSIDPKGISAPIGGLAMAPGYSSPSTSALQYDIVFVDPSSGQVIEATLG